MCKSWLTDNPRVIESAVGKCRREFKRRLFESALDPEYLCTVVKNSTIYLSRVLCQAAPSAYKPSLNSLFQALIPRPGLP